MPLGGVPGSQRLHPAIPEPMDPSWTQRLTAGFPTTYIYLCTPGSAYKSTGASSSEGGSTLSLLLAFYYTKQLEEHHCRELLLIVRQARVGVLSLTRAPNLGTSQCYSLCLSPIPPPAPAVFTSVLSLSLAIPMASAVTLRQLAPTMGQAEA